MCFEWVFEALDMQISVEVLRGDLVRGTLRSIDDQRNLVVEAEDGSISLVPAFQVCAVILPPELLCRAGAKQKKTGH